MTPEAHSSWRGKCVAVDESGNMGTDVGAVWNLIWGV